MSSHEDDESTIAEYIQTQDAFRKEHDRAKAELVQRASDVELIANRCFRLIELKKALFPPLLRSTDALKFNGFLINGIKSEMSRLHPTEPRYFKCRIRLIEAQNEEKELKEYIEKQQAPTVGSQNALTEIKDIRKWISTPHIQKEADEMIISLVSLNTTLPQGKKLDISQDNETTIAINAPALKIEMQAKIKKHADLLVKHVCDNTPITLLIMAYDIANLGIDDTPTDPNPIRADIAKAIRSIPPECCICCFNDATVIVMTKCKHSFHNICITEWLARAKTCPICRAEVLSKDLVLK